MKPWQYAALFLKYIAFDVLILGTLYSRQDLVVELARCYSRLRMV
jgi:hypothetical protein